MNDEILERKLSIALTNKLDSRNKLAEDLLKLHIRSQGFPVPVASAALSISQYKGAVKSLVNQSIALAELFLKASQDATSQETYPW